MFISMPTTSTMHTTVVEQTAFEMPNDTKVLLKIADLRLFSNGVFSNVYRGTLREPVEKEIAIKKTWPDKNDRNFEFVFLTGRERDRHKNIIHMLYAFSHSYGSSKVCESYVFDFVPDTLASAIRTRLADIDVRLYTWQMFNGLTYLEEHLVIHRDLKPVNILVDHSNSGALKIGDFGSSKVFYRGKLSNSYQVTRFYRPPELLLKAVDYEMTIDTWSAGCVVAEMVRGTVVFPGRDGPHQLKLICRCLGAPNEMEQKSMKAVDKLPSELAVLKGYGLQKLLPDAAPDMIQFVSRILVFTPKFRLRGRELLQDPFFKPLFKPGATRPNDQLISKVITADDYKLAIEEGDPAKCRRLSALTTASRSRLGQSIPVCEKSNSYENIHRRSTLLPREQKLAREQRSKEDEEKSREKGEQRQHPSCVLPLDERSRMAKSGENSEDKKRAALKASRETRKIRSKRSNTLPPANIRRNSKTRSDQ